MKRNKRPKHVFLAGPPLRLLGRAGPGLRHNRISWPADSVLADASACFRGSHRRRYCHRHEGVGRRALPVAVVKEDHCLASSHLGQTAQQRSYTVRQTLRAASHVVADILTYLR